jgi:hypothetical protein
MMRERQIHTVSNQEESMTSISRPRLHFLVIVFVALAFSASAPAEAQREYEPLFDKFNFKAELSWVGMKTSIGLFEQDTGEGGVLNFEDDLNLGDQQTIPSLDFEWQIAKRHRVAARWQNLNRDSNAQALTNIEWGDETIPIDADITLAFDTMQLFVDYTFYPWVKERWAAGFGLGLRWMDLGTTLTWRLESGGVEEGSQDLDVSAPLPYINFEYRRLLTERWRMIFLVGWLDITIGDVGGGQYIGKLGFEYLLGKRWAVGGGVNYAAIDVDAENIEGELELVTLRATLDMDIWDLSIFGRVRF